MTDNKNNLSRLAIVLPSLNPDEKFSGVVSGLLDAGFDKIVIVNDGSDEAHSDRFAEAAKLPQCKILVHEVNKGKGRALKDAFRYIAENMPEVLGVVTIDGDGQHLTKDIVACGEKMLEAGDKVVLGCRAFDIDGVPARSLIGNRVTSLLFRICYGIRLSDTQTGLRAIPAQYLLRFSEIEGERFEYETNMLLMMHRWDIGLVEQRISTVYEEESYSSHFNGLKDSWRIFKVMFKYLMSSLGATLVDLLMFYLVIRFFGLRMGRYAELGATVIARAISSFVNFNANNSIVFKNNANYKRSMLRYYCLVVPQMLASAGLVTLINHLLANSLPAVATLIKLIVDVILFFISYRIQREWVFTDN